MDEKLLHKAGRGSHPNGISCGERNGLYTDAMGKLLQVVPILMIVVGAVMLSERPAYAYTDPGTGLLAIQAAGSALVAAGWYLRRKLYALFSRNSEAKPAPEPKEGEGANLQ